MRHRNAAAILVILAALPGCSSGRSAADAGDPRLERMVGHTPAWTVIGNTVGGGFTRSVARVGDVDGDGYDDVMFGASLFRGSFRGLATVPADIVAPEDQGFAGHFGNTVAGGDLDGDGYADALVSAPTFSGHETLFAYRGSAAGLEATPVWSEHLIEQDSVATADVNGDGYIDVVVGAWRYSNLEGGAVVFLGSASGLGTAAAWTVTSGLSGGNLFFPYSDYRTWFGARVASAGDVNGDGYDDVEVSMPGAYNERNQPAEVFVYYGSAAGPATTASWHLAYTQIGYGWTAGTAGDVDGDGFDDLLIDAPGPQAELYLGSAAGLLASPAWTAPGKTVGGAPADVDGDGYFDVLVTTDTRLRLYRGGPAGPSATPDWSAPVEPGTLARFAGDVDGDGDVDILTTEPTYDAGQGAVGAASVYENARAAPVCHLEAPHGVVDSASAPISIAPGLATDRLGRRVAAGDFDGDGIDDLAVAADGNDAAHPNAGAVLIFTGPVVGPLDGADASEVLVGDHRGERLGRVLVAGDLDGDGGDDLLIGTADGTVYVVTAVAGGPIDAVASGRILGTGLSVAAFGGDLDGDTVGDVVVAAPDSGPGAVWVIRGPIAGDVDVATSAAASLVGTVAGERFGAGLLGPGDIDGDGIDDLLVGAPGDATGGPDAGAVHVFSFLPPSAWATVTGGPQDRLGKALTADAGGVWMATKGRGAFSVAIPAGTSAIDAIALARVLTTDPIVGLQAGFDVNGDGETDLLVGESDGLLLRLGPFNGTVELEPAEARIEGASGAALAVGDIDGDGAPDLIGGGSGVWVFATTLPRWYGDPDLDGYGGGHGVETCRPVARVQTPGDCAAADAAINPSIDEICNGIDDDCDGRIDRDAIGSTRWYVDSDGDGFAADNVGEVHACTAPAGMTQQFGDCDDNDATVGPGAPEICDQQDNDCDGRADEADQLAAGEGTPWFNDWDGDGFGGGSAEIRCKRRSGQVADGSDCDDRDPDLKPGATEICNGRDDDCDGSIDEAVSSAPKWYADADGDGFGAGPALRACEQPDGRVADRTDCDDGDARVRPGGPEQCNGVDDDCDGLTDDGVVATSWYADADHDGFGDAATAPVVNCVAPAGTIDNGLDCDDSRKRIAPGATEVCNGDDDDCDGLVDDADAVDGAPRWFLDADGDGLGGPTSARKCIVPANYVATHDDCDDSDAAVGSTGCTPSWDWGADNARNRAEATLTGESTSFWFQYVVPDLVGDLDGDGLDDVVFASEHWNNDKGKAYFGVGGIPRQHDQQLAALPTYVGDTKDLGIGRAVAVGDLDGDGFDDVVLPSTYPGSQYLVRGRSGPWAASTSVADADAVVTGALGFYPLASFGDFDGDGTTDWGMLSRDGVAVVSGADLPAVAPDDADLLWVHGHASFPGKPLAFVTGDLDGDGRTDLVARRTTNAHEVWLIRGTPTPALDVSVDAMTATTIATDRDSAAVIDDIDGDGVDELALSDSASSYLLRAPGQGVDVHLGGDWGATSEADTVLGAGMVQSLYPQSIGDIDGDGYHEVVYQQTTGQTAAFIQRGRASWAASYTALDADIEIVGPGGMGIGGSRLVGDFDGDGTEDVVGSASSYFVYRGRSSWPRRLALEDADVRFHGSLAYGVVVDLDGDGCDDLVTAADEMRVAVFFGRAW